MNGKAEGSLQTKFAENFYLSKVSAEAAHMPGVLQLVWKTMDHFS